MTAIVIGHVVFSIYHSGRTVSPFSIRRTLKWLFNYGIEIGTHTVSVRSVVVVRIAVVVDIGEIGSGIRDCQLSEDEQNEIAAAAAAGEDIKATEIQKIVDEKKAQAAAGDENDGSDDEKKEKRSITEQKTAQMSDTDTTEKEKANARRLHALKMLEKYYIYMSDEEVGILERMLEDCKRRKREYGIEDVGSTI